jgi:hypothetical protein
MSLGRALAALCPLPAWIRRRRIRPRTTSRLAALERGKAVHQRLELRLRRPTGLAIGRHGLLRGARRTLS